MNYGAVEIEIAARLTQRFADLNLSEKFHAAPMPETQNETTAFQAQAQKACVAVEFLDCNFGPDKGLGLVAQDETLKFRLYFEARKMRGVDGLYAMVDHVKKFLVGYKPTDCDPITLAAYGKLQFEPSVWMPYLDIQTQTMNVQTVDSSEVLGGPFMGLLEEGQAEDLPEQLTEEFTPQFA